MSRAPPQKRRRPVVLLALSAMLLAGAPTFGFPSLAIAPAHADDGDDGGDDGGGRGGGNRGDDAGRSRTGTEGSRSPAGASRLPIDRIIRRMIKRQDDGGGKRQVRRQERRRPAQRAVPPAPPPPPEFVVAVASADDLARITAAGYTVVEQAPVALIGAEVARLRAPAGTSLDAARAAVVAVAPTALVDLNTLYRPDEPEADEPPAAEAPCTGEACPAFEQVGWLAPPRRCAASPVIGMVDTGVNAEHDALAGRALEVVPLVGGDRRAADELHGTAVAALFVGDTPSRSPGLLPEARLIAVEAFHRDAGGVAADAFALVRAIDRLAGSAEVISLSLSGPPNALVERTVAATLARNVAIVAAAGNEGPKAEPRYPAAYPGVVAVTAVDARGRVYRNADQGPHIAFAAPGVQLSVARSVRGVRQRSGTSYAVPFVAAAIASARDALPDPAAVPVADTIAALAEGAIDIGDDGRDPVFGFGLVQAPPVCANPALVPVALEADAALR